LNDKRKAEGGLYTSQPLKCKFKLRATAKHKRNYRKRIRYVARQIDGTCSAENGRRYRRVAQPNALEKRK
jgi:hypothetical protein